MIKISTISRLLASSTAILLGLTACSTMPGQQPPPPVKTTMKDGAPPYKVDVSQLKNPTPKYEPKSNYGNPASYTAEGKRYYVMDSAKGYVQEGVASWYGTKFHGRPTSSREPYDMLAMTAASPSLPIPTYVRVTNLENGKQVIVRVNDRGPFASNRIMDLSYAAAKKLDYAEKGTAKVRVEAIHIEQATPATPIIMAKNTVAIKNSSNKQIYLQVGAFDRIATAQQVKTKVGQFTHLSTRIEIVTINDKKFYRVQVGPLRDGQQSDIAGQLQHMGYNNAITIFI